jgi:hypothetical protein
MFENDNDKKNKKNKKKPGFNAQAFKHAIGMIESSGGKFLNNTNSSAAGKYHFLFNLIKDDPEMSGISKREFINRPELQEKIMDKALKGNLQGYPYGEKYANKLKKEYGSDYDTNQVSALVHFLGPGNTRRFLKDPEGFKVPGKGNATGQEYLSNFQEHFDSFARENEEDPINDFDQERESSYPSPREDLAEYSQQPIDNTRVRRAPSMRTDGDEIRETPENPSKMIYDLDLNGTNEESNDFEKGGNLNDPGDIPKEKGKVSDKNVKSVTDYIDNLNGNEDLSGLDEKSISHLRDFANSSLTGEHKRNKSSKKEGIYTKNQIDSLNKVSLKRMLRLSELSGNSKINIKDNKGNSYYNPITNNININRKEQIIDELAHGYKQKSEGKSVIKDFIDSYVKKPFFTKKGQRENYDDPDQMEFDTHEIVQPILRDYAMGYITEEEIKKTIKNYRSVFKEYFDNIKNKNKLKQGGSLGTGTSAKDLVTIFEGGGTHAQNPNGGIPQGTGANGKPNLVEEGETKWNDYIFSNEILID